MKLVQRVNRESIEFPSWGLGNVITLPWAFPLVPRNFPTRGRTVLLTAPAVSLSRSFCLQAALLCFFRLICNWSLCHNGISLYADESWTSVCILKPGPSINSSSSFSEHLTPDSLLCPWKAHSPLKTMGCKLRKVKNQRWFSINLISSLGFMYKA